MNTYVNVIVNNKSKSTDIKYTYLVPDHLLHIIKNGSKILVPFGIYNRLIEGYVIELYKAKDNPYPNIKKIKDILEYESILTDEIIELCIWMKEKYLCTYMDSIRCVIPSGSTVKTKRTLVLNKGIIEFYDTKSQIEKDIIAYLKEKGSCDYSTIIKNVKSKSLYEPIKRLETKGIINIQEKLVQSVSEKSEKSIRLINDDISKISKSASKQIEIINYLKVYKEVTLKKMKEKLDLRSNASIKALEDKKMIEIVEKRKYRNVYEHIKKIKRDVVLTTEQYLAYEEIKKSIDGNFHETYLIHGVTGSGKTEVYINAIERVMKKGKEALLLVPEISLTSQMIKRIKEAFGDVVGIIHSKLSLGEQFDQWEMIRKEKVKIVIGARSAIFVPFKNLGIIIIDEEHEYSYKSDNKPRYHAIEVAKQRAKYNNCPLLLGSATPSIEAYYKSMINEYVRIELLKRHNDNILPKVEIVDMREELKHGNKNIISMKLYEELKLNLENNKQSILFLNRRGHSTFISCRKCGYVVKCHKCDVSLTFHAKDQRATCHYCGYNTNVPTICPSCGSKYIKHFGAGTQKVEIMVKKLFPEARIKRFDLDTTSKKGSVDEIIEQFSKGEIDILIGTQMLAKGLDFPNVTLVGIIAADMSLNIPNFRSSERTFQLITQVSGRAGRGSVEGRVILQTYSPEHFAIKTAMHHDYISFYNEEILMRKITNYPPYSNIINIVYSGENEKNIIEIANEFSYRIKKEINFKKMNKEVEIYGPNPAPISKVKSRYRWQTIVKTVDQNAIRGIINYVDTNFDIKDRKNVLISIDINAYSML